MIGAGLGLIGTVVSVWANLSQKLVFAGTATFAELNLFSIFPLIPLAPSRWRSPRDAHARWLTAFLGAVVFGLAFSS